MNGANQGPSTSSTQVGTGLDRNPTWAKFDFDDGFDLKLDSPSTFPSLADPTDGQLAPSGLASSSQPGSQSSAFKDAATSPSAVGSTPAIQQPSHEKRSSAGSNGSNKDLPRLPGRQTFANMNGTPGSTSSLDRRSSPSGLPISHSANTVEPNSSTAPLQRNTPRTPQHGFASPIVTAPTPEQKQRSDSDSILTSRAAAQQTPRSHSTGVPSWDRSTAPVSRPVSSADAYMQPIEALQTEAWSSRPGTAMSHLSGSNWMHDGTGNRSSYSTPTGNALNQAKRASVLSFQTAVSGGFMSGDEGRVSDRGEDFEEAQETLTRPPPVTKPWLDNYYSGYGSSPDDRTVPGALPSGFWGESSGQSNSSTPHPTQTGVPRQLSDPPTAVPVTQVSNGADPKAIFGSGAATDPPRTPALPPKLENPTLAPVQTNEILQSPRSALSPPLSSTTVAARSDDADTQVGPPVPLADVEDRARSALSAKEEAQHVAFEPESTPRPIAKDPVQIVEPPLPPKKEEKVDERMADALAGDVIPPPLPVEAVNNQNTMQQQMFMLGPADHKPVSDYRQKPLADISPASKAAGLAQLEKQAESTRLTNGPTEASARTPETQTPVIPMMERGRRKSTASLTTTAALASATATAAATKDTLADRSDTPSNESRSREASPPPDGEVEARAEWERRQMKRKAKKEQPDAKANKGRSDTLRGQLKPLQLVPAENFTNLTTDRRAAQVSSASNGSRGPVDRRSVAVADRDRSLSGIDSTNPDSTMNVTSGANFSTQQLQKLQAREQRRSVGAFSAAMAAANVASSGSNGPYPVFASPGTGPQKAGLRQYPGLMAQRSLVPPFELQHRPDGLPSGLIGPDGVRRSLNDPEVCLECMMRDEDMIDIRVLGEGIWERESDREFEEALRLEAEEEAKINGLDRSTESAGQGTGSTTSHRDSRSIRRPLKRIGKGDPLTVDRLKLHTQMNPPASSFRWRTLQTFLAVQAKYIAMEQQRMRAGADNKRLSGAALQRSFPNDAAIAAEAERLSPVPVPPARDASALPRSYTKDALLADDDSLTRAQREDKQRDIAAAQAARKKMALASPTMAPLPGLPSYPSPSLQTRSSQPALLPPQEDESFVNPPIGAGNLPVATSRRVLPALVTAGRVESVPDLRSAAESRTSSAIYPSSPAESLIPPTRSFVVTSPTTPSRYANRSGTSQLSMMHSGSMIDMHVAQEDRAEHRLNQNGFIPGTPLAAESPSALNRPYYGFPGDGDSSLPDASAFERSRLASGDGYLNPQEAGPTGLDLDRQDSGKQRKKGFRGLFSKLTGGSIGPSREGSQDQSLGAGNAEVASRNPSKRSQASTSPRLRQNSISADRALDTSSSANANTLGGVISKARKSTSSLFSPKNGLDAEPESRMRSQAGGASLFQSPPGMASQSSLELGPFQPASPTGNAGYVRNKPGVQSATLPADGSRMRKASNPLMQKYLNSPSPRTQAASGFPSSYQSRGDNAEDRSTMMPAQFSTDSRNGRISSFASMKDLRTQSLQPILDTQRESISSSADLKGPVVAPISSTQIAEGTGQANAARASQASARKELPPMPAGVNGSTTVNAEGHQRNDSSGTSAVRTSMVESQSSSQLSPGLSAAPATSRIAPLDMGGRRSMQMSRTSGQGGSQFTAPSMAFSSSDAPFTLTPDDASIDSNGPRRPPKNPRRPDGSLNSASIIDLSEINTNPNAPRDFPRPPMQDEDSFNPIMNSPESKGKSGKSKFLRFGFGRKKRESTLADSSHPTIIIGDGIENRPTPANGGGTLPRLRGRKSYSGLGVPKSSFQAERQRVLSSPAGEVRDLPPRSQSAFGMLSTQRFVSMDARRSMNVSRNSRLSVMQDEEEEDDEMEREPGYEAEFDRYDQEAMQSRYQGGSARGRDVSGGAASFGRKSLNLLREGFRMPLKQPSNDQSKKKRFGF